MIAPDNYEGSLANVNITKNQQNQIENNPEAKPIDSQQELQPVKGCYLTRFQKIVLIATIVFLSLLSIALGVGLSLKFKMTMQPLGTPTKITFPDGTFMVIREFLIKQDYILDPDVSVDVMISAIPQQQPSRLLQEVDTQNSLRRSLQQQQVTLQADYNVYANFDDAGIHLTFAQNQTLAVQVDVDIMFDYLVATEPQLAARLLQSSSDDQEITMEQFHAELGNAFTEEFTDGGSGSNAFAFAEVDTVELSLNTTTQNFEITTFNSSQTPELVQVSKRKWLKKMLKPIKKVVKVVVKPVVKVVAKHGAKIGMVAGALVGGAAGILGGPAGVAAGIAAGAKLGGSIGLAAQTAVQACVPKDSTKIKCTAKSIKTAIVNNGIKAVTDLACDGAICPVIQKTATSAAKSIIVKN